MSDIIAQATIRQPVVTPLIIRIITETGTKKVNQMINIANNGLFSPVAVVGTPTG